MPILDSFGRWRGLWIFEIVGILLDSEYVFIDVLLESEYVFVDILLGSEYVLVPSTMQLKVFKNIILSSLDKAAYPTLALALIAELISGIFLVAKLFKYRAFRK